MLPRGESFTPTDTVPFLINTNDLGTGEGITWDSGAIRLMRYRTETWTEITDAVGYTLDIDWDPSASPRVGLHVGAVDLDGLTNAAAAGDLYVVVGSAGTVDTENMINLALCYFWVQDDGLTAQQKAHVQTEVEEGVPVALGVETLTVAVDVGNSATSFEVGEDAGAVERWGTLVFTSGNLDTEEKPIVWSGTTVTVFSPTAAVAGLEALAAFSAEPTEGATAEFWPARS